MDVQILLDDWIQYCWQSARVRWCFELLAREDEAVLVQRDALIVLDLCPLTFFDGVCALGATVCRSASRRRSAWSRRGGL